MSYVNAIVGEFMGMNGKTITPQYQAPKKPWVGLTKEEKQQWIDALPEIYETKRLMKLLHVMESRLKTRNT